TRAVNRGRTPIRLHDIVVLEQPISLPPETALYGEGFQMLTQTAGTLARPGDLSQYTDAGHYRIPAGGQSRAYYRPPTLTPPGGVTQVSASPTCARFRGRFAFSGSVVRAIVGCEGLPVPPGGSWPLEELMAPSGPARPPLLASVADRLASHPPPLKWQTPPTG